jgi:hypothetical protein
MQRLVNTRQQCAGGVGVGGEGAVVRDRESKKQVVVLVLVQTAARGLVGRRQEEAEL